MANIVSDTVLAENIHVLVDTGHFGSRVEEYLDDMFRSLKRDSFYSETLAAQGREAAEVQLAHWTKSRNMHAVANAVSPLAAGIAKVIATGHKDLRVTHFEQDVDRPGSFPFPYGASHGAYGVALHHPVVPGCGCMQPRGFNKFASSGNGLRIKAFVVLIDPLDPRQNSVALMLPIRDSDQPKAGYVALTFRRNGDMYSERIELMVYDNTVALAAFGGRSSAVGFNRAAGGSPCEWLGFPGAEDYVVSALGELVEYLEDMAVKLSATHQH